MKQLLFLLTILSSAGLVLAIDPPETVNFQGVLRDANDAPRDGDVDMLFRFFDAANGGTEILIDRHELAGTGPVTVANGLFNVQLGGGDVVDGAGPGVFSSLADVLIDKGIAGLWMQIEVDDGGGLEILSPRVEVISSPFALQAGNAQFAQDTQQLNGQGASFYLNTGGLTQTKTGALRLLGGLDLGAGSDDDLSAGDVTTLTDGGNADALHTHTAVQGAENANTLDGLDSTFFLDTSAGDQQKLGALTVGNLTSGNDLAFTGPDRDQDILFFDSDSPFNVERLRWDDSNHRLIFTDDMAIVGPLYVGNTSSTPVAWNQIGVGTPDSGDVTNGNDLFIGNDLEVDSVLYLNGRLWLDDDGPDSDQFIYFYGNGSPTGEFLQWDELETRFELSDALAISGAISTGDVSGADTFNRFGSSTPDSADISSVGDAFVSFDLEVGDQIYMAGGHDIDIIDNGLLREVFDFSVGIRVGDAVGENVEVGGRRIYLDVEGNGGTPLEYLEFLSGEFNLSDDLDVFGTLTANSKNFVQAHPVEKDLEIVYTTLEGPEAGVFTRGSARLSDGMARVALEETFAWVANPDVGLTVFLTPRGQWADLYVESVTSREIVVRSAPGAPLDATFDYMVMGLHVGYEEAPAVRPRTRDALLPAPESLRAQLRGRDDLVRYTPLERYRASEAAVFGRRGVDLSAGRALTAAIGTDPDVADVGLAAYEDLAESMAPSTASRVAEYAARDLAQQNEPGTADAIVNDVARNDTVARMGTNGAARSAAAAVVDVGDVGDVGDTGRRGIDPSSPDAPESHFDKHLGLRIPVLGDVRAGDVLVLDLATGGARRADLAGDATVIGVALDDPATDADGKRTIGYAVAGVVTCRVDGDHGAILPGDVLVSSQTAGHAMSSSTAMPGTVLGKALESHDGGPGTIRILLSVR